MTEALPMTESAESSERRRRQRFIARRRGAVCFWVLVAGERHALHDLSLEGFAMPAAAVSGLAQPFAFVLQRDGVPDEIRGQARVVNVVRADSGEQAGCLFELLERDGPARLEDWLTAHVLANASVPITERDAVAIVSGPSLI